jgi:hypothetical protein
LGLFLVSFSFFIPFSKAKQQSNILLVLFFLTPALLIFYWGIKILRNGIQKKLENRIKEIPEQDIIIAWEISGREWDRFKEDKCSPTSIKRTTYRNTLLIGLAAWALLYFGFAYQENPDALIYSLVLGVIASIVAYYITLKTKNKYYGNLYNLPKCHCEVSNEWVNFCRTMIPTNTEGYYLDNIVIHQKGEYNAVYFHIATFSRYSFNNIIEIPIPNDKIPLAKEAISQIQRFYDPLFRKKITR